MLLFLQVVSPVQDFRNADLTKGAVCNFRCRKGKVGVGAVLSRLHVRVLVEIAECVRTRLTSIIRNSSYLKSDRIVPSFLNPRTTRGIFLSHQNWGVSFVLEYELCCYILFVPSVSPFETHSIKQCAEKSDLKRVKERLFKQPTDEGSRSLVSSCPCALYCGVVDLLVETVGFSVGNAQVTNIVKNIDASCVV